MKNTTFGGRTAEAVRVLGRPAARYDRPVNYSRRYLGRSSLANNPILRGWPIGTIVVGLSTSPQSSPDINTTRTRPEPSCPKTNTVVTRPGDPRMRKAPKGCTLKWLGAKNQAQARPAGTPVAPHKVQPTTPCPRGHLNTLKVLGKDISSPEVSTPSRVR